jgi:hypothetical protein
VIWPAEGRPAGLLLGILLGAPFAVLGVLAGSRLAAILECPTPCTCTALAAVSLAAPFATGTVDLYLRFQTP